MKYSFIIFSLLTFSYSLFTDSSITRGPDVGEIYYIGPTATQPDAIYHSTDFGETATCMDSTLNTNINFMSICADLTLGVLCGFSMPENLYISYNYGSEGSWTFRNSNVSYRLNSGVTEGFLYHGFSQHSEDYGFNFIQHSYNGFLGSSSISEIDVNQNIGYVRSVLEDSLYFFISYDNFENLEVQNVFNSMEEPIGNLTRGFYSGELYTLGINKDLKYSSDFGYSWETKNSFTCPSLPIKGIVGGRQPGELYILVEYVQLMYSIVRTDIYHSTDYGETFTVYNAFSYGPEPYYANFIATPIEGTSPLTVQFTDISSGENNQEWQWDFDGDGEIDSTEQNPDHTYEDAGTFEASLTIFWTMEYEMTATQEIIVTDSVSINNEELQITDYELSNFPNPFNPSTEIRYQLSDISEIDNVLIEIYNSKGQIVDSLPVTLSGVEGYVTWDAEGFSSSVYFYKLNIPSSPIKKMILMK